MSSPILNRILLKAMDSAREGICIADATCTGFPLIYVNKGFEQMTGYGSEECLGRSCNFLQGPETEDLAIECIRQHLRRGEHVQVELTNYRKDRRRFLNRLSLTPIFNDEGMLTHYIGVQDDITAQRENERLRQAIAADRLREEAAIEAQEAERRFIGQELHDNVNQLLASVSLRLNIAEKKVKMRRQLLPESREIVNTCIAEIRKLSHRLVGPQELQWPLGENLHDLVIDFANTQNVRLSCRFANTADDALRPQAKLALYRVAQEHLTNIGKHARAQSVHVELGAAGGVLRLLIRDDGIGFNTGFRHAGIGLANMQTRMRAVRGSLQLLSAPGKGCTLEATIPLDAPVPGRQAGETFEATFFRDPVTYGVDPVPLSLSS